VHVIGHHWCDIEVDGAVVVVNATVEYDLPGEVWQQPFFVGAESDEVGAIITLKMRQLSAVEASSQCSTLANVGTAALGCPADCRWQRQRSWQETFAFLRK
jgi:hypothetical protein